MILDEQKLQATGIAESEATRIGHLVGVEKLIKENLFMISEQYELLVKTIDVGSGKNRFL